MFFIYLRIYELYINDFHFDLPDPRSFYDIV